MRTMTSQQEAVIRHLILLADGDSDIVARALRGALQKDGLTVDIRLAEKLVFREKRKNANTHYR